MAPAAAPQHVPWTHWVVAARYVSALTVYYSAMGQLVSSAVDERRVVQPMPPIEFDRAGFLSCVRYLPVRAGLPRLVTRAMSPIKQ